MPKRVDHEERRRQIADALLRTAATRGLHAAGMREVAAEAGVSLRLVQYYFGTKEELMLFAMQQLAAQFAAGAMVQINKVKQAQDPVSPRDVIAAILTQALPVDEERRTFTILNAAYFALSLTEPALAIDPLVKNSNAVIDVVASQLRAAQAAGGTPTDLDPDLEALSLLAMSTGLGTSILAGQSSPGQAQAVIDYHLDRLFPAPPPALPRRRHGRRQQAVAPDGGSDTQRISANRLCHGISGEDKTPDREDLGTFRRIYETNVFGVVAVTNAFLPTLRRSAHPRIVNISSGTGSLAWATGPQFPHRGSYAAYRSSKTALNALTVFYAHALAGDGIKVNALAPGLRRTDLNATAAASDGDPAEAAAGAVWLAMLPDDGPSGEFFSWDGTPVPW